MSATVAEMVLHLLMSSLCYRPQANDAGDYFPIWGTCQGLQQLSVLTANRNLLTLTDTKAVALPLNFTPGSHVRAGPLAPCLFSFRGIKEPCRCRGP